MSARRGIGTGSAFEPNVGTSSGTRSSQYEVLFYDSAHGRPHLDILGWEGESVDKQWLADEPLAEAATAAIIDVKTNWWLHRERFMRRKS